MGQIDSEFPNMTPSSETPRYLRRWRQPRFRYRLWAGLVLLALAAGVEVWSFVAVASVQLPADATGEPPGFVECVRLGYRSFVVVVLSAVVILCAMRPLRRGRADYARLAAAEMVAGGLLISLVLVTYWLWWSPLSFIK